MVVVFDFRSRRLTNRLCWVLFIGISVIGLSCWSSGIYDCGYLNCRPRKGDGVNFNLFLFYYRLVFFMSRVNISNRYCRPENTNPTAQSYKTNDPKSHSLQQKWDIVHNLIKLFTRTKQKFGFCIGLSTFNGK